MTTAEERFLRGVRQRVTERVRRALYAVGRDVAVGPMTPGKMLRTRLAARLKAAGGPPVSHRVVEAACVATELVHSASLCHDDVIDGGLIRRGAPTLWRVAGPSGAILMGDVLFCEALEIVLAGARAYAEVFVSRIREVCAAEAEQEIHWRGRWPDEETCLRLARGKTGPLFAFVARVCGGSGEVADALEEAGYRIGTAYQLADDLVDLLGDEASAGKTLGSDARRGKRTLAQVVAHGRPGGATLPSPATWGPGTRPAEAAPAPASEPLHGVSATGRAATAEQIGALCDAALACAAPWPGFEAGIRRFLSEDLQPYLDRQRRVAEVSVRCAQ